MFPPTEHHHGTLRSWQVLLPVSKPYWRSGRIWTCLQPWCQLWAPAALAAAAVFSCSQPTGMQRLQGSANVPPDTKTPTEVGGGGEGGEDGI